MVNLAFLHAFGAVKMGQSNALASDLFDPQNPKTPFK